ncbi:hypothetical protein GGS23DRAFT_129911 [Durotheca rogersii]|uniref:uncharacterized protein n=1 Tax=Durotheca rogersii TaxID=419775 RepID=UPI002220BEC6|nr:uncharacterized protein GGS23DRAFT_129911 [Durotheca rogersii]KAI5861751.1 hypothetical protein GGS23DRAFT_129911 [Durotheca rogersii]
MQISRTKYSTSPASCENQSCLYPLLSRVYISALGLATYTARCLTKNIWGSTYAYQSTTRKMGFFFTWLARPTQCHSPTHIVSLDERPVHMEHLDSPMFANLRELEVYGPDIHYQEIILIIRKFSPILRKLVINHVYIHNFRKFHVASIISQLSSFAGPLENVKLHLLGKATGRNVVVQFRQGSRVSHTFSYAGSNLREELEGLRFDVAAVRDLHLCCPEEDVGAMEYYIPSDTEMGRLDERWEVPTERMETADRYPR